MVEHVPNGCLNVRFVMNLYQHLEEQYLAQWLFEKTEATPEGTMMFITIMCWDGVVCI